MATHALPSSMALSREGELVSAGFTETRPPYHPGKIASDWGIKDGGRDFQSGSHEGWSISWGLAVQKKSVPVVDMQLAASRRGGVTESMVAEITSPGVQAGKGQGTKEEQGGERMTQEMLLARGRRSWGQIPAL